MKNFPDRRILHVIESTTAGVRRYVTYLLQHKPDNWEMEVACPTIRQAHFGDTAFVDDIRRLGIRVHDVPMLRSIGLGDVNALRELWSVVRRGHYDLLHTHSSKAGFLGRLTATLCGVPVVHTPNGLYYLGQRGSKRRFYRTLEQVVGRLTTQMIAVSAGERDVIVHDRLVQPDRVYVIENGVDGPQLRAEADSPAGQQLRATLPFNGHHPIIGAAGRLVPQKDPLAFVRVAARLKRSLPGAQFVWCGDGELRAAVEQLAAQLNVPLLTFGYQENCAAIMRAFDVLVLPSLYEGLPFALLEAMALEVPVVASDVMGIHDVVGTTQAGWLAAPQDETALAEAIYHAVTQPAETQRRVQAARQLVETHYTVQRMVGEHLALYARVMQRPAALSRRV